jgi:hypothetical protein
MSDARAIEAVTQTLRGLLDVAVKKVVTGASAVARPPDQVTVTGQEAVVNLFLYQAEVDPALRNTDPQGVRAGETADPALPLVLSYLLTPFTPDLDDLRAHRLLGAALGALHAHTVLTPADLRAAAAYSDVGAQFERVRIDWQPFEEKDIFSMWSVFQAPYRMSVAFEVRVVLLDGRRPPRAPLPVLTRGADDRGPVAAASVASPVPTVATVDYPAGRVAVREGETVVLRGAHLADATAVRISHPALTTPVDVVPAAVGDTEIRFTLPATVPAGLASAAAVLGTDGRLAGDVSVAVAPTLPGLPLTVARDAAGTAVVTLACVPDLWPTQQVELLLGGLPVPVEPVGSTPSATGQFRVTHARTGDFPVRLRVDGVESVLVPDRAATPPVFDPTQRVTVT